jgi:hypothetical protein
VGIARTRVRVEWAFLFIATLASPVRRSERPEHEIGISREYRQSSLPRTLP